jgi:hypothetical protein
MSRQRTLNSESRSERGAIGAVRFLAITGTIAGALALTGGPALAAVDAGPTGRTATVSYDNGKDKKDSGQTSAEQQASSDQTSSEQASAGNGGNSGSDSGSGNTTTGNSGGSTDSNANGGTSGEGANAHLTAADIAKGCVDTSGAAPTNDPVQNLIAGNPVVGDMLTNNSSINPATGAAEGQTNSTTNPADTSVSDAIRTSIDQALQCDPASASDPSGSSDSNGSGGSGGDSNTASDSSTQGFRGNGHSSAAQSANAAIRDRVLSGGQSSGGVAQNAIANMTANNAANPVVQNAANAALQNAADPPANNAANPALQNVTAPPSGSNTRSASVDPVNGAVAGPASTGAGGSDPTITAQGGDTTASTTAQGGAVMSGTVPKAHLVVQDKDGVMTVAAIGAAASAVVTVPHGEMTPPKPKPVAPPAKPAPPMKTVEVPPASLPPAVVANLPSTGTGPAMVLGADAMTDLAAIAAAVGVAAVGALGLRRRSLR